MSFPVRRFCGFLILLLAFASGLPARAQGTVLHVPGDAPTIQAGIDAAQSGDTVLVAPGTYTENIDFKGKGIVVTTGAKSYTEAKNTLIRPAAAGMIVTMSSSQPASATLNGFTIQGAYDAAGLAYSGGVLVSGQMSAKVTNNFIYDNQRSGVWVTNGTIPAVYGGPSVTLQGNDISGTKPATGNFDGYGVIIPGAQTVEVIGNVIENGVSDQNTIGRNGYPQALLLYRMVNLLVQNNVVRNNVSGSGYVSQIGEIPNATVVQNLLYGNTFAQTNEIPEIEIVGGLQTPPGCNCDPGRAVLTEVDNTFSNVLQQVEGTFTSSRIENNIFFATSGNAFQCVWTQEPELHINYDNISAPGTSCDFGNNLYTGDPLFVDPAGGDFHLRPNSPDLGVGDLNAPQIPATDLDGNPRVSCGGLDLGVYQSSAPSSILTSSEDPSVLGDRVSFTAQLSTRCTAAPTGVVTFLDGTAVLGTANLGATSPTGSSAVFATTGLATGLHSITASFPGDLSNGASVSNTVTQLVGPVPVSFALTGTPNPANQGDSVTLTAQLSDAVGGPPAPGGTVTFSDQFGPLGTAPLVAVSGAGLGSAGSSAASLTIPTLTPGTHSITAAYPGTSIYAAAKTAALVEVIVQQTFTISLTTPTLTIASGQKGQTLVDLASLGGYTGNFQLSAGQVPQYGTLTFAPAQLTLAANGTANATLSFETVAYPPGYTRAANHRPGSNAVWALAWLACLPLCAARRIRRACSSSAPQEKSVPLRRRSVSCLLLLTFLVLPLAGCGNLISLKLNSVAPGTYIIPITATDRATNTAKVTNLTLVITP